MDESLQFPFLMSSHHEEEKKDEEETYNTTTTRSANTSSFKCSDVADNTIFTTSSSMITMPTTRRKTIDRKWKLMPRITAAGSSSEI
jgi:hypothetical protein